MHVPVYLRVWWMYFCIHAILHHILSTQNMTNKCRRWVVYPVYDHFQIRMPTHVNLRYSRAVTNFLNCLNSIYSKLVAPFDWWDSILFWRILNYCWWKNSRITSWSKPQKMHLNGSSSSSSLEAGNGFNWKNSWWSTRYRGIWGVTKKQHAGEVSVNIFQELGLHTCVQLTVEHNIMRSCHHKTKYTDE